MFHIKENILNAVASIGFWTILIRGGSIIHHFQECLVSNFFSIHCRRNINLQQILFPASRKDLGVKVTSVLVIQVQGFFTFMRGFKKILYVTLNFIENKRM
jgi:hypothetical protein